MVASELSAEGSGLVVNLASNEYFAVLDGKLPKRVTVVAPDFRVMTANGLKFEFHRQGRRGAMARWICDERIAEAKSAGRVRPRRLAVRRRRFERGPAAVRSRLTPRAYTRARSRGGLNIIPYTPRGGPSGESSFFPTESTTGTTLATSPRRQHSRPYRPHLHRRGDEDQLPRLCDVGDHQPSAARRPRRWLGPPPHPPRREAGYVAGRPYRKSTASSVT